MQEAILYTNYNLNVLVHMATILYYIEACIVLITMRVLFWLNISDLNHIVAIRCIQLVLENFHVQ